MTRTRGCTPGRRRAPTAVRTAVGAAALVAVTGCTAVDDAGGATADEVVSDAPLARAQRDCELLEPPRTPGASRLGRSEAALVVFLPADAAGVRQLRPRLACLLRALDAPPSLGRDVLAGDRSRGTVTWDGWSAMWDRATRDGAGGDLLVARLP